MSTLLLIPWIILGYKHPSYRFLGLCQTKKSLLILLIIEVVYWIVLAFVLGSSRSVSTGEGSFAWKYILFYEKGIIPIWVISEKLNPSLADRVDANFRFLYLISAIIMDYIFLFILSPRVPQLFASKRKRQKLKEGN